MKIASFEREILLWNDGYDKVIGIDEAGRGSLAGPVVAAACVLRDQGSCDEVDPLWDFVRDSKNISQKNREIVYDFVCEKYFFGVGIVDAQRIDEINILQATFESMRAAITSLEASSTIGHQVILLVDGNAEIPSIEQEQKTVVEGDSSIRCIAAASIIAKVTRDRIMKDQSDLYPEFGFGKHKGYGTKMHLEALREFGATPIHRRSFGPVRKVCIEV